MELLNAFILDLLLGDPQEWPHPVRWIGNLIVRLEKRLYVESDDDRTKERKGRHLTELVILMTSVCSWLFLAAAYSLHAFLGLTLESVMCYTLIAPRCLRNESMKVYRGLQENDVEKARKAVSMIVGRDTGCLDVEGITKAAVETVAENTSDGVTAPLLYMAFGGAPAGFFYKAVNTLDSMIGYKNEKYLYFGRFAARLDDVCNYLPSRITALTMILSSFLCGLDGKKAYQIWKRDRRNHASPNSAQTEAVCAGALQVQLAGDASYFGKIVHKKTIGDAERSIEPEDIPRANRLMYVTTGILLVLCVLVRRTMKKRMRYR